MGILNKLTRFFQFVAHLVNKYLANFVFTSWHPSSADDIDKQALDIEILPKPFSEIPGPLHFPVVGSQWLYYWPGPYSLDKLHLANEDKFLRHGPIVKEHYLWNFPIIHLYDKKDIEEVLRYPSKFPLRPGLEVQCAYRKSRPDRYNSVGLVNAQGLEWYHLRSKLIPQLVSPALKDYTVERVSNVADELIEKILKERDHNFTVHNFEKLVYRFGLEAIFGVLLNQRLGALKDTMPLVAERLMLATENLFEVSHETMYGLPWWKYFPTEAYRKLTECEDIIYDVFADIVNQALNSPRHLDETSPVLDQIINAKNVDIRDKIVTLIDLVAAGIETTGNATLFLLHNILSNAEVKEKVYAELDKVFLSEATLRPELLTEFKYLKACVTESLRLTPVAPNVARISEKSYCFQDYHVPAGTLVVCETWVASLQEDNYCNAKKFVPERWIGTGMKINPFLAIPFGIGRRMCPGKRIAEDEMLLLAVKLLQKFDIEFEKPLEQEYKFLITPKGPISMILKDHS